MVALSTVPVGCFQVSDVGLQALGLQATPECVVSRSSVILPVGNMHVQREFWRATHSERIGLVLGPHLLPCVCHLHKAGVLSVCAGATHVPGFVSYACERALQM